MPRKGQFKENVLLADHDTWQEWSIASPTHPNAVLKIDTVDMIALRKRCGGRIVAASHHGNLYAHVWDGTGVKRVHRLILGGAPGMFIDHANHDGLDNRRQNLRPATRHENAANGKVSKLNTSGVSGVNWAKRERKWRARIVTHQKEIHLGYFRTKTQAIEARKVGEIKHFGAFAYKNPNNGEPQC